jgi:hypothetical protein
MSLDEWSIHNNGAVIVGVDPLNPIRESGSLRMRADSLNAANLVNTTYVPGLIRGRMRMLIRVQALSGVNTYRAGFLFMQSDDDMANPGSVPGIAYSCGIRLSSTNKRYFIHREDNGLETASGADVIFESSDFSIFATGGPGVGSLIPLEVEWKTETLLLGGILITLRGSLIPNTTTTNFSNLTELGTVLITDPLLAITTSSAEGVFIESFDTGVLETYMDDVSVFSLAPN